ncbi:MAG: SGNH/GDSL hydrolase family protein [Firmicutes bacterium]|nr:SGNH/GDSL hydrolase family protein [Bacillota bacterium]
MNILLLVIVPVIILCVLYYLGTLTYTSKPLYRQYLTWPPDGSEEIACTGIIMLVVYIVLLNIFIVSKLRGVKAFLVNLIIILFFFGALEFAVRNYSSRHYSQYRPDPELIWKLTPGGRNNSEGFRTGEIPGNKEPNEFRIIIAGDSSAYGLGIENGNRFGDILETILQQKHPDKKIRVINTACPGYTIFQVERLARQKLYAMKPDCIIISLNNDPNFDFEADRRRVPPPSLTPVFDVLYNSQVYLLLRKNMINHRAKKLDTHMADTKPVRRLENDEIKNLYNSIISKIKQSGGSVIVAVMPNRPEVLRPSQEKIPEFKKFQREFSEEAGAVTIDFFSEWLKSYEPDKVFLPGDVVHPNNEGNRIIAEKLAEVIENNKLITH